MPERVGFTADPHATTTDAPPTPTHLGQVSIDPLERALLLAAEAGRFDVVAKLADELHGRRCDRERIASIHAEPTQRERTQK